MKFYRNNLLSLLPFLVIYSGADARISPIRLYRGEGDLTDSINGVNLTEVPIGGGTGGVVTFPDDNVPYGSGSISRKVVSFTNLGRATGPATGLPGGNSHRTIVGWFKVTGATINGPFGYGRPGCNNAYYLWIAPDKLELDQWCQTEGTGQFIKPVVLNQWYHVAATYDGTNNMAYVNGKLVGSGVPDAQPNTQVDATAITAMGGNPDHQVLSTYYGYVADFAIFDRALFAEEVESIYNDPNAMNPLSSAKKVGISSENTFKELPDNSFNLEKDSSNLIKVNFNVEDTQASTTYAIATDQASATELYFTANAYKNKCADDNSQVPQNLLEWVDIELSIEDDKTTVVANMTNTLDVPLVDDVLQFCFVLKMMLKVPIDGVSDVLFDGVGLTFVLSLSHLDGGETVIEFTTSDASTIDEEVELSSGDVGSISKDFQFIFGSPTLYNDNGSNDNGSYSFGDVIEIRSTIEYTGGNNYFAYEINNIALYEEDKITLLDAQPVNPTSFVEDISDTLTVIVKLQMPLKVFQLNLEKIVIKYTIAYEKKNSAGRLLSTIDNRRILEEGSNMSNTTDDPSTIESGTSETEVTVTLKPLTREDLEAAGIVTDEEMRANGLDPNDYPKNDLSEISEAKNDLAETSSAVMVNVAKYLIAVTITATFLG